jgi:hypothetical protein
VSFPVRPPIAQSTPNDRDRGCALRFRFVLSSAHENVQCSTVSGRLLWGALANVWGGWRCTDIRSTRNSALRATPTASPVPGSPVKAERTLRSRVVRVCSPSLTRRLGLFQLGGASESNRCMDRSQQFLVSKRLETNSIVRPFMA